MIDHVVMLAVSPDVNDSAIQSVFARLYALVDKIDGFVAFKGGRNLDLENKSPDYPYGFVATFKDRAALEIYASDPRHTALGMELVALCEGDPQNIVVYDLERIAF